MVDVVIINHSTVLADGDIAAVVPALQTQVSRDFGPSWGVPALLHTLPAMSPIPAGWWPIWMLDDDPSVPGALGYHEDPGRPDGKVLAKTTIEAGLHWTVTLSHELVELLGDPTVDQVRQYGARRYAYEAADPCEADEFGYLIDGVLVSDFVLPTWFTAHPSRKPGIFDFAGHITKPRQLIKGGYAQYQDSRGHWHQITDFRTPDVAQRPGTSGRSERRRKQR